MRKKILLVLIFIFFAIILIILYILSKPTSNFLSSYLSKSEHANANILIVEGWLPDSALEIASEEFRKNRYEYIITTGLKASIDYYGLFENGFLNFYLKKSPMCQDESELHSIEVDAYSELGGEQGSF
jgi:hypothetical protein